MWHGGAVSPWDSCMALLWDFESEPFKGAVSRPAFKILQEYYAGVHKEKKTHVRCTLCAQVWQSLTKIYVDRWFDKMIALPMLTDYNGAHNFGSIHEWRHPFPNDTHNFSSIHEWTPLPNDTHNFRSIHEWAPTPKGYGFGKSVNPSPTKCLWVYRDPRTFFDECILHLRPVFNSMKQSSRLQYIPQKRYGSLCILETGIRLEMGPHFSKAIAFKSGGPLMYWTKSMCIIWGWGPLNGKRQK